jgi:hypothetical protein
MDDASGSGREPFSARAALLLVLSLLAGTGPVLPDGIERLGPLQGVAVHPGNRLFAAGVGLEKKPSGTITIEIPPGVAVRQVLLYWGERDDAGDDEILLQGTIRVRGLLAGTNPFFDDPALRPFVHRADITTLGLVREGVNQISIGGLDVTAGRRNGAGVVVIGEDSGRLVEKGAIVLLDGCDFAFFRDYPPQRGTRIQRLSFAPASEPRTAELTLLVGDHQGAPAGANERPSVLEVRVEGQSRMDLLDPLAASDGDSWDTLVVPLEISAGAGFVDVELFSQSRTGGTLSPSSFYWLFAGLNVLGPEIDDRFRVSGSVYCDTNGDGAQGPAEPGIAGVEVAAVCTLGDVVLVREGTTDALGRYEIARLPAGFACEVAVVPSPATSDKEPTEECAPIPRVESDVTGCDFGFAPPPLVGDTVFSDQNGDGAQQPGEPGLAGVRVTISAPPGNGFPGFTAGMTTDAGGKYLFAVRGVPFGSTVAATVAIDPDSGEARGKVLTTANPQQTIPLGLGGADLARDFGLMPRPPDDIEVSGTVFCDRNADGSFEAGEPGLSGVLVTIECPAVVGFPGFSDSVTTPASGAYLFVVPGPPPGTEIACTVRIDPESGEAAGKTPTTPTRRDTPLLGPGASVAGLDFGLAPVEPPPPAEVSGLVFCDQNADGAHQPGEPGLSGVAVMILCPAAGSFPGLSAAATTAEDGSYLFWIDGLPEGTQVTCAVAIDPATGEAAGKILTSPNPQETVPLGPGDRDPDRDFGLRPVVEPARVSGTVFCDLDGNGLRDAREPGIAGVRVTLDCPAAGGFPGFRQTVASDVLGDYAFQIGGIPPGGAVLCSVTVDAASPETARKELTTSNPLNTGPLGPGDSSEGNDFGFRPLAARVGDTVFCDNDGDGVEDPGEAGISGVLVTIDVPASGLFGGLRDSRVTDGDGQYLFLIEGIPSGVQVVATVTVDPGTGGAVGKRLTTPNPQATVPLVPDAEDLRRDFGFQPEEPEPTAKLIVESGRVETPGCADVRVLLTTSDPVEGFTVALRHDPEIVRLEAIGIEGTVAEDNQAEFVAVELPPAPGTAGGGTVSVIMDLHPPFLGNSIPPGDEQPIAVFRYCCDQARGSAPLVSALELVDGVLGMPPKDNVVVVRGRSVSPVLCDGSITCVPPGAQPYFTCGGAELGPDNVPVVPTGGLGGLVEVCFYYCSQFEDLQGFTMAVAYDCELQCVESSFRVPPGSVLAEVEAEFVTFRCDNDPGDGDGCELVLGVLVDVSVPHDGRRLPASEVPRLVGCADFRISSAATCGTCLPIEFTDGINGPNKVPVKNLIVIDDESFPAATRDCQVCITAMTGEPVFVRGDCNNDGRANMPDAAATVSYLFYMMQWRFDPPCLDACDANDDGRVDLADAVSLLGWLFRGGPAPPAPGPLRAGPDPTPDKIGCAIGSCT